MGKFNFTWETSLADSPWRQGKCERWIRVLKRLIRFAVGDFRLSPIEFQTILFEAANLCNKRPVGINKKFQLDVEQKSPSINAKLFNYGLGEDRTNERRDPGR